MILLGVGIVLIVLAVVLLRKTYVDSVKNFRDFVYVVIVAGVFAAGVLGVLFGMFVPLRGYEEPQLISTTEATFISYEEEDIYLFYDDKTVLCYEKTEVISANGKDYEMKPKIFSRDDVEIIPVEDCKMPRIEKYILNGESSFPLGLATKISKTQYKVYVPEGTIWEVQD